MGKKPNNLTPKILALLFALFLWTYVMGVENPERDTDFRNVNVVLQNTAELKRRGLVVMEPTDFKVTVRITGKQKEVLKVKTKNIVAQADLSGYGEGQQKVGVTASIQDTSANVRIVSVEPRELLVTFDKVISKEKSINIITEGNVDENYVLDEIVSKPQTILLSGPRTWVNEVAEARVVVNMEGRTSSTSLTLPIQLLDDQGEIVRGVDKDPTMVDVAINILRKKTLPIRLKTTGELPDNYNLNGLKVSPENVTIKGDSRINDLEYINTKPIDIKDLVNNQIKEIELDLPEEAKLLNPNEKFSLKYNIEEIIEREYEFNFSEIEGRNLGEGLRLEENSQAVIIKLKGLKNDLENLVKANIKTYIDLMGLEEGSHELPINMEDISGIKVESILPQKIQINIIKVNGEE